MFDVDLATFATFTNQAINVKTAEEFIKLCRGPLHHLFPYRMLLAGAGYAQARPSMAAIPSKTSKK